MNPRLQLKRKLQKQLRADFLMTCKHKTTEKGICLYGLRCFPVQKVNRKLLCGRPDITHKVWTVSSFLFLFLKLHLFADESMLFTPRVCKCDNLCEPASCKWPGVFWLPQTYGLNIKVGNILGDNWVSRCRNHGNLLLSVWQKQTVAMKRSNVE